MRRGPVSSYGSCALPWPSGASAWPRAACHASSSATASREKSSGHAAEQDRPDVRAARETWFEGQLDLDPDALVFIDETAATTAMARRYGRAPRGERCRMSVPQGHWKTTTVTAGLRASGITAPWLLDGAMNSGLAAESRYCGGHGYFVARNFAFAVEGARLGGRKPCDECKIVRRIL